MLTLQESSILPYHPQVEEWERKNRPAFVEYLRRSNSTHERLDCYQMIEKHECQLSMMDPWYAMTHIFKTKDEHPKKGMDPYQTFPREEAVYHMVRMMEAENRLLVPKSRQLMVSWTVMGWFLWCCLTRKAERIAVQSKKEESSTKQLERVEKMWERLPERLRKEHPMTFTRRPPEITFHKNDCSMHGLAQGEDQARSLTYSRFFMDEMAFQDLAEKSYTAALPTLDDCQFIGVSSASPGFFQLLVEDQY